jgi:DNA-directed RNA polymerase subunit beta'
MFSLLIEFLVLLLIEQLSNTKGNKIQIKNKGILTFNNIKMLKNKKNQNIIISRSGKIHIIDKIGNEKEKYKIPYGSILYKNEKKKVKKNVFEVSLHPHFKEN